MPVTSLMAAVPLSIYVTQAPRMNIRFLTAVVGPEICVTVGEERDLPIRDAEYWISVGYAEKVEEPVQKKVTVQEIKRTAKRVMKHGAKTYNGTN